MLIRVMIRRSALFARRLAALMLMLLVAACESDNEHFCARYQLLQNMADPKKEYEQARFMLFVLDDWYFEMIPVQEPSRDFCIRMQRWQGYPSS
jgi:hypothetical protein